jgi:hypothetical protein
MHKKSAGIHSSCGAEKEDAKRQVEVSADGEPLWKPAFAYEGAFQCNRETH